MFRFEKIFAGAAIMACAFTISCSSSSNAGKDNEGVARVGSRDITMKQVDAVIKQQLDQSGGASLSASELVAARLSVLDTLIQQEALFQKAQKDNLVPDDNKVNQEIQKRKQEAGLTEEQYQEQLKQAGLTEAEHREDVKRDLAITALTDAQKARVSPPTEAEIRKYYDENKEQFRAERGADISVIAVSPNNNGGEAGAEQKIRSVYAQLRSGADFATVASQKSEEQASALRGGRLGFASEPGIKQAFPALPNIGTQLMSLTEGQYTEPVKDTGGNWYIFKLNAKREQPQNLTFDDVRKNIVDALTQQRQQLLLTALIAASRNELSIKNFLADRILTNPQSVVEMRPSALLDQSTRNAQTKQAPARFENQNESTANRSAAASSNSSGAKNANRK